MTNSEILKQAVGDAPTVSVQQPDGTFLKTAKTDEPAMTPLQRIMANAGRRNKLEEEEMNRLGRAGADYGGSEDWRRAMGAIGRR